MSTRAPWANPVQHPYLSRPSLKRKHSFYTSASSEVASSSPTDYSPTSDISDLPNFVDSADTTIDASQGVYRPLPKRRRHEPLGVEGDFDGLALERGLSQALLNGFNAEGGHHQVFWDMGGDVEVEMVSEDHSASSILHPSSFHSPEEQKSALDTGDPNWYEGDRIVITSLDSDSDSLKSSPIPPALTLENGELVASTMVAALKGEPLGASSPAFGSAALFDARRYHDLTPLERMTAGMIGGIVFSNSDEEMIDVTPTTDNDEMMDVEV